MRQVQASKRQRNSVFRLNAVALAARHLVLMAPMLAAPVAYAQTASTASTANPATTVGSNSNAV
ncbi:hypothetical protein, partial [Herbaspirillum sp. YR522]|uniref:hypothetical protein n=1 Tax=Herbaspirillum sp. YR522 TaxID=1144342 RepID=UPI00026F5C94